VTITGDRALSQRFVARASKRPGESRNVSDSSRKKGAHRRGRRCAPSDPRELSGCLGRTGQCFWMSIKKKKEEKGSLRVCSASLDDLAGLRRSSVFERWWEKIERSLTFRSYATSLRVSLSENLAVNLDNTRNHYGGVLSRCERTKSRFFFLTTSGSRQV